DAVVPVSRRRKKSRLNLDDILWLQHPRGVAIEPFAPTLAFNRCPAVYIDNRNSLPSIWRRQRRRYVMEELPTRVLSWNDKQSWRFRIQSLRKKITGSPSDERMHMQAIVVQILHLSVRTTETL